MKKLLLFAILLVLASTSVMAFSGLGTGTSLDPYQIINCSQLQEMDSDIFSDYILMNDIDCSETSLWNFNGTAYEGFDPIAEMYVGFEGIFEGNNNSIFNLYINLEEGEFVGLFAEIENGAEIRNVFLENVSIKGYFNVGGLVGLNQNSTITNVFVSGTIEGFDQSGMLVGNNDGLIEYARTEGSISGWANIAGIVGDNDGELLYVFSSADVSGDYEVGGIAGTNSGNLENSYFTGTVYTDGDYAGGIVGANYEGRIINTYSTGLVAGNIAGGSIAYSDMGIMEDNFYDLNTTNQTSSEGALGKTTLELYNQNTYTNWLFDTEWGFSSCGDSYPELRYYNSNLLDCLAPTTLIPLIMPSNPLETNDLIGYCNANNTGDVNYNWQWYLNDALYSEGDTVWCHQETATNTTSCGAVNPGSYSFDNTGHFYINYTKPALTSPNSLWTSKHGDLNTYNSSIDLSCWNAYTNKLVLRFTSTTYPMSPGAESYGECFDGFNWTVITDIESASGAWNMLVGTANSLYDGDYGTGACSTDITPGLWGSCTSGVCNKAILYEESLNWRWLPQIPQDIPYNIDNISYTETTDGEDWILSCQAVDEEGDGLWVNSTSVTIGLTNNNSNINSNSTSTLEWNMFGRTLNNNRYYPDSVNISNFGILWNFSNGFYRIEQPVISNNILYASTDGLGLYALNATTGDELWHSLGISLVHTASIANNSVFVGYKESGVRKISSLNSSDGFILWTKNFTGVGSIPSPTIFEGVIFTSGGNEFFYALDSNTGDELWKVEIGSVTESSPAIEDGIVYVAAQYSIFALNSTSGDQLWNYTSNSIFHPSALLYGENIFIGGNDGNFYSLNKLNGSVNWIFSNSSQFVATSAVYDNSIYVPSSDGLIYALNITSGNILWNSNLGVYSSSPVVSDNYLFVGSQNNNSLFILNKSTGNIIFSYDLGSPIMDSLALVDDVLYVPTDTSIYAFKSGQSISSFDLEVIDISYQYDIQSPSVGIESILSVEIINNNLVDFVPSSEELLIDFGDSTSSSILVPFIAGGSSEIVNFSHTYVNGLYSMNAGLTNNVFDEDNSNDNYSEDVFILDPVFDFDVPDYVINTYRDSTAMLEQNISNWGNVVVETVDIDVTTLINGPNMLFPMTMPSAIAFFDFTPEPVNLVVPVSASESLGTFSGNINLEYFDSYGSLQTESSNVIVNVLNHIPTINTILDMQHPLGTPFTYSVIANDLDVADTINHYLVSGPSGLVINSATGELSGWTPVSLGVYSITVGVTDGYDNVLESFNVEVVAPVLCEDTDGGIDYSVRGTITTPNGVSKTDHCTNEPWGAHIANLIEYYCLPDQTRAAYGTDCIFGCTNGTCNSVPVAQISISKGINKDVSDSENTFNTIIRKRII